MTNKKSKILLISEIIYVLGIVYSIYYNLNGHSDLYMVPISIAVPFIIPIVFKLLKIQYTSRVMTLNLWFCFFASIVGSTLGGYNHLYYDKVVHFFSGVLLTIAAYILFCVIKKIKRITQKEDITLMYLFINAVNLAIAVLWEFYEFAVLLLLNNDCIRHYTTGVYDSMTDMISAFIGGIIVTVIIFMSYKNKRPNFITKIYEEIYELNQKI